MPDIAPCAAFSHIPEVNPMNHSATNATHAAHVATSREVIADGNTEAPCPEQRDTAQPVAQDFVEPGASHRLPTVT